MKQLLRIVIAGCLPHMTKVGVGVGVGIAVAGCMPARPMTAIAGGLVGGAVVVGWLIGYAIGKATPPANE